MKQLFNLLALAMCFSLWSCGNSNSDVEDPNKPVDPEDVYLDVYPDNLTFDARGGEKTFEILCNGDWTITNNSEWYQTDVTSGNGGHIVKVTTSPYYENIDQSTELVINAGYQKRTIQITQLHGDVLVLTKDTLHVAQEGGEFVVEVESNISWNLRIPWIFDDWIRIVPESKSLETKTFTLSIAKNGELEKRKGFVIIEANSIEDTVFINQATYDGEMVILETNDDVKNFAKRGLTKLAGNLIIQGDEISTLTLLDNKLENIEGSLIIMSKTFSSFDGLYGLKEIGKDFQIISDVGHAFEELTSFEGLNNLEKIGGDFIINPSKKGEGLNGGKISSKGLEKLRTIGGNFRIIAISGWIHYCFQCDGLNNLTEIGGDFEINGAENIFESFQGLYNLKEIRGNFKITTSRDAEIYSFEGLENLSTIGGDFISNTTNGISAKTGLKNLTSVGGNMDISLKKFQDINLDNLKEVNGNLTLKTQKWEITGNLQIPALQTISGSLTLNNIGNIANINNLKSIEGDITIKGCKEIYDFCIWKPILSNHQGNFLVVDCGYNPTKYNILNGECSQPSN